MGKKMRYIFDNCPMGLTFSELEEMIDKETGNPFEEIDKHFKIMCKMNDVEDIKS